MGTKFNLSGLNEEEIDDLTLELLRVRGISEDKIASLSNPTPHRTQSPATHEVIPVDTDIFTGNVTFRGKGQMFNNTMEVTAQMEMKPNDNVNMRMTPDGMLELTARGRDASNKLNQGMRKFAKTMAQGLHNGK